MATEMTVPAELRTVRLRLVPLDVEAMRLFVDDWSALQRRVGAKPSPAWVTDRHTLEAALRHRDRMLREPDAWLWWTFWQVVLLSEGVSLGLIDFKGPPGREGGAAVGFSFAPAHGGHGYATEAVGSLVAWALGHSSVRFIAADTDVTNVRSHRVLRKLGFVSGERVARGMARHGEAGDLLAWRLGKQGEPSPGG